MLETLLSWDAQALSAARGWIDPSAAWFPALKTAVVVLADSEVLLFAATLVGLWLYGRFVAHDDRAKREALRCFWLTMIAFGAYWAVNFGLPVRARPETVSAIPPLVSHLPDNSFPSGHAIFWAASVVALFAFSRRWLAWTALVLGALMCWARVLAGIHYPGDIVVGALMGLLIALLFLPVVKAQRFGRVLVTPVVRLVRYVGL